MKDTHKTKAELIEELNALRLQVEKLQGPLLDENTGEEVHLQSLVDALPAYISYIDNNHCYKFVNQHYEQWLNRPREQIVGHHLRDIIGEDAYAQARPYLDKAFSGQPVSYETTLQERDGSHVYNINHTPDIIHGEVQGVFVLVTEITEYRNVSEELARKEKFLSNAQRIANLASVEWDVVNDSAIVSGEHVQIFGVGSEYFEKNAGENFLKLVHPEDREFIKKELDRCINSKTPAYFDYRIIREDGSVQFMHDRFEVICDDEGQVVKLTGSTQDVTERKKIEEDIHQEKDFVEQLIETARAIILVLDTDGCIVRFNPYMEDVSGYKLEEVKGQDWFATCLPESHHEQVRDLFKKAINDIETQGNINPILTKDGDERIIEWHDTTLHGPDNNITGLLAIGQDITDRIQAEEELREEKNFLKAVFSSTPDFQVFKDKDCIYRLVNPAFCKSLQKEENEIIGKTDYELFPEREATLYRKDDKHVMETGEMLLQDELVSMPEGKKLWLQVAKTRVCDTRGEVSGVLVSVRDISERKQAEQNLAQAQAMLQLVFDTIPVRVFWKDQDSRFLGCNRLFAKDAGLEESSQIIGKTDHDLCWADQAELYILDDREVMQSRRPRLNYEEQQKTPAGELIYLETSKMPLMDDKRNLVGILGTYQNITERKQVETDLIVAKEQAEAASQAKSQFLSRMSHELRTPLNAILGFSQVLEAGLKQPDNSISQILKAGWHLLDLVNDLLDLSAIEADEIEMYIEPVNLEQCVQDSLGIMQPLAQQREIIIRSTIGACAEKLVQADPLRFKQVLLNLLSNAVKYNKQGGNVMVSCAKTGADTLRISVTDTGAGISESDMSILFEPFNRLYLDTYAIEGTGIGLTISKQLVERMDGAIGAYSELGQGSTFWIELPLSQSQEEAVPITAITPSDAIPETEVVEFTMLYIEDSPSHIQLLETVVKAMPGIRLLSAHTPTLGLELAQVHQPDLIALDIGLPGMDGFEVLKRLRASEVTREIPVMAISANAMARNIEMGLQAGFCYYLTKPINIAEFKKVVEEFLCGGGI